VMRSRSEPLSEEELRAIAARVAAATSGLAGARWLALGPGESRRVPLSQADVEFIAEARADVLRLLGEIERLQGTVAYLRTEIAEGETRFLAAMRELTKEISEARGLYYSDAARLAADLVFDNVRRRMRGREAKT
jgi:hypothetical protein